MRRLLMTALCLTAALTSVASAAVPPCVTDEAGDDGVVAVNEVVSQPVDEGREFDIRAVHVTSNRTTMRLTLRVGDLSRVIADPVFGVRYVILFFPPETGFAGPGAAFVAEWRAGVPRFTVAEERRIGDRVPSHPIAIENYELVEIGSASGSFVAGSDQIMVTAPLTAWPSQPLRRGGRLVDFVVFVDRTVDTPAPVPSAPVGIFVRSDYARSPRGAVHVIGTSGCRRAAS